VAKPFYQPVVDAITPAGDSQLPLLRDVLIAIDTGNTAKLPIAMAKLIQEKGATRGSLAALPDDMYYEGLVRLLVLARPQEFRTLFDWNAERENATGSLGDRRALIWDAVSQRLLLPQPKLSEKNIDEMFKRYRDVLAVLLEVYQDILKLPVAPKLGGRDEFLAIERFLVHATTALMHLFEQSLETALLHLARRGADRGAKLLALHARWQQLRRATFAKYSDENKYPQVQQMVLPLTVMKIEPGRSRYQDAFLPHDGRSFDFTLYNRDDRDPPRPEIVWLGELLRARSAQLRFLLILFGEHFEETALGPNAPKADLKAAEIRKQRFAERRQLIDKVAGRVKTLDLRNEDAMAEFLCAFFHESVSARKGMKQEEARSEAWTDTLRALGGYWDSQTTHSDFNLAESPSYLERLFPRALQGGELYDCGVYAVKGAYILLKLGHCVSRKGKDIPPPSADFLLLPLHIGLVVRVDEFPPVVVQNQKIEWMTADGEIEWRGEWDNNRPVPDTDPAGAKDRRAMFIEDFAVQNYITDLAMPVIRVPLAKVSSPPKKTEIWSVFDGLNRVSKPISVFIADVDKPGSQHYQFDLKYLSIQQLEVKWRNEVLLPFWNKDCFELWGKWKDKLATMAGRKLYAAELKKMIQPISASYDKEVKAHKFKLADELALAAVANPLARVTDGERVQSSVAFYLGPLGPILQHLDKVEDDKESFVEAPAFATEDGRLRRVGG
jgi:hypothetical protein